MEKLAITCKILYDQELLGTKKELKKYKNKYDIPKINVTLQFFQKTWITRHLLNEQHSEMSIIDNMLCNVVCILQTIYENNYKKYEDFFKNEMIKLKESLIILHDMNDGFISSEEYFDIINDYTWHFLNHLFEKVNWMYCSKCNTYVNSCRGLCNDCDIFMNQDDYNDNTDMLADAIDH